METVQHMQRLADLGRDHVQVRPPHVATDKAQARRPPRGPNAAKPRRSVAWVRFRPTHNSRRQCRSIW